MQKKNRTRTITIVIIAIMALSLAVSVFAADRTPDDGWISYNGRRENSSVGSGINGNNNTPAANGGGISINDGADTTNNYTGNTTDRYRTGGNDATGSVTDGDGIRDDMEDIVTEDKVTSDTVTDNVTDGDTTHSGILDNDESGKGTEILENIKDDMEGEDEGEVLGAMDKNGGVVGIVIAILIAVAVIVLIIALVPKGASGM